MKKNLQKKLINDLKAPGFKISASGATADAYTNGRKVAFVPHEQCDNYQKVVRDAKRKAGKWA